MKITAVEPIVLRLPGRRHESRRRDPGRVPRPHPHRRGDRRRRRGGHALRTSRGRSSRCRPRTRSPEGCGELLVGEDPLAIGRLWKRLYDGSSYYGRSAVALHVHERDRHRALGHRRQGGRAARLDPPRRRPRRADRCLRERGDARDARRASGGSPSVRSRPATARSSSAGGRSDGDLATRRGAHPSGPRRARPRAAS